MSRRSNLKRLARQAALADYRGQRSHLEFAVIGDNHGEGRIGQSLLHDDVAAPASDFHETVGHKNAADFASGEDSEPTQSSPRAN
jgi:hypothetical protein